MESPELNRDTVACEPKLPQLDARLDTAARETRFVGSERLD